MTKFVRENQLLSLCGLNCGLCPMQVGGYCPGCGGGPGNQICKIARCSLEHPGVEYCFQCTEFPCSFHDEGDAWDSFITYQNRFEDLNQALSMGVDRYNRIQQDKIEILNFLLKFCNDGRRKSFYCLAVNLLSLEDLRSVMDQISNVAEGKDVSKKQIAQHTSQILKALAQERNLSLVLRKKTVPAKNHSWDFDENENK